MTNVLMITGVLPPRVCGVGDYTQNILNTECARSWRSLTTNDWSLFNAFKLIREINKLNPNIIFMQYPAEGYGWSLVPHILALYYALIKQKNFITVLHEYSSFKPKGRFFVDHLLSHSSKLIFTTEFELQNFAQKKPEIRKKSFIIPILSNVPSPKIIKPIVNRSIDILYFGHIRPNKGLENYLRVAKEVLSKKQSIKIKLVGQIPKGYEGYLKELDNLFPGFMEFTLPNADTDLLLETLNDAKICFLPFPDGVSERRGSFLASTQSGAVVVSYRGPFLTNRLEKSFVAVDREAETDVLLHLLSNTDLLSELQNKSLEYHATSTHGGWNDIARAYLNIAATPLQHK